MFKISPYNKIKYPKSNEINVQVSNRCQITVLNDFQVFFVQ